MTLVNLGTVLLSRGNQDAAAVQLELAVGTRADLAAWRVEHPRDLVYFQGDAPLVRRWVHGAARQAAAAVTPA